VTCRDDVPVVERLEQTYGEEIGFYMLNVENPLERNILMDEFSIISPATTFLIVEGEIAQRWYGPLNEAAVRETLDSAIRLNNG